MNDHQTNLRLMRQAADAALAAHHSQAEPTRPPRQSRLAAGQETHR
jgi:hypothetical protein